MQKKVILALLMAALLAGGAFAQGFSMSAGAGMLFDLSSNNGVKYDGGYSGMRILSLGFFGFFDATYAEVDVSFAYGNIRGMGDGDVRGYDSRVMQLGFTFLGKYPFEVGDFIIFPLLGFDYNMVVSHTVAGYADPHYAKLSQLGALAGVGADFYMTDSLYLRGEGMFHLRFPSTAMREAASAIDGAATFGMGPRLKAAVGYKF
ncbi:MAG: hypothetical protein LBB89_06160 [Treponema sp.]|jgi:hypothetical protein|nr:hypothetical protein [Treponema sp.]